MIENLKKEIEKIIDPSLNASLKETKGILDIFILDNDVVKVDLAVKNKDKDSRNIRIKVAKIVKIDFGHKGVLVNFFDSKYESKDKKEIIYLAIASGKGGVGKSTVTANLAYAFKLLGKNVGIIDADIYGASIPYIFKMDIKPLSTNKEDQMIPLNAYGIEIISTEFFMPEHKPLMWRGPMLGKMLTHYFNNVSWNQDIDIILIDLPPGTGDIALDVKSLVPKSKVLIVTTPNVNASNVALKAGLGAIEIGHEVIGIIENMSYYINPISKKKEFIFGENGSKLVGSMLKKPIYAKIPIGQPENNNPLYQKNEIQAKMYLMAAKKILSDLEG